MMQRYLQLFLNFYHVFSPGEYVALAGARLDGAEMHACGLATHFVQLNVGSLLI
jgi:enoyl-CoA hydratase/carnithine racemase